MLQWQILSQQETLTKVTEIHREGAEIAQYKMQDKWTIVLSESCFWNLFLINVFFENKVQPSVINYATLLIKAKQTQWTAKKQKAKDGS